MSEFLLTARFLIKVPRNDDKANLDALDTLEEALSNLLERNELLIDFEITEVIPSSRRYLSDR